MRLNRIIKSGIFFTILLLIPINSLALDSLNVSRLASCFVHVGRPNDFIVDGATWYLAGENPGLAIVNSFTKEIETTWNERDKITKLKGEDRRLYAVHDDDGDDILVILDYQDEEGFVELFSTDSYGDIFSMSFPVRA